MKISLTWCHPISWRETLNCLPVKVKKSFGIHRYWNFTPVSDKFLWLFGVFSNTTLLSVGETVIPVVHYCTCRHHHQWEPLLLLIYGTQATEPLVFITAAGTPLTSCCCMLVSHFLHWNPWVAVAVLLSHCRDCPTVLYCCVGFFPTAKMHSSQEPAFYSFITIRLQQTSFPDYMSVVEIQVFQTILLYPTHIIDLCP